MNPEGTEGRGARIARDVADLGFQFAKPGFHRS